MFDEPLDDASLRHLVLRVARHSRRRWLADLEPFGLSPHLARALEVIARQGDSGLRGADVAVLLRISARSATEVVDALSERGLVERTPSPSDRRAKVITLTPAGVDLWTELKRSRDVRDDVMFEALTDAQQQELRALLLVVLREQELGTAH